MKRVVVLVPADKEPYRERAIVHARQSGDAPIRADDDAYAWLPVAHLLAVYVDHGITPQMADMVTCGRAIGLEVEYRTVRADAWAAAIRAAAFPENQKGADLSISAP